MNSAHLIGKIKEYYATEDVVPLHIPVFIGNEKEYVNKTIESTMVSSVGAYVDLFEQLIKNFTHTTDAIAVVNGTCGLTVALDLLGVRPNDLVITQSLTFVATGNAILHHYATPVFIDVDINTLSLCPIALKKWLDAETHVNEQARCVYKKTGQIVKACIPMHTFGHIGDIEEVCRICKDHNIAVIEDAAEALGSFKNNHHAGHFGQAAALSFNGNKIITTGGGGMILTMDYDLGKRFKHITTTAKINHPWEYFHDEKAYNYRLPNINAALGCAQMENIGLYLSKKRDLAQYYKQLFAGSEFRFVDEPIHCRSNFWLNAIICKDKSARDDFLNQTHAKKILTRPIWVLLNKLPMFKHAISGQLHNAAYLEDRVVNLPSWIPHDKLR